MERISQARHFAFPAAGIHRMEHAPGAITVHVIPHRSGRPNDESERSGCGMSSTGRFMRIACVCTRSEGQVCDRDGRDVTNGERSGT
jgi:hypothetical protein